jgi:hypothetical protein
MLDVRNAFTDEDVPTQEMYERAYDLGPLGQTRDAQADPVGYYGTRGALTVATAAAAAAATVGTIEFVFHGNVPMAQVNIMSSGNVFRIISRPFRTGFRIDPAHHGKPWGHTHFWRWQ